MRRPSEETVIAMGWGQAANVAESGGGDVAIQTEQQEIADGGIVQFRGNVRDAGARNQARC